MAPALHHCVWAFLIPLPGTPSLSKNVGKSYLAPTACWPWLPLGRGPGPWAQFGHQAYQRCSGNWWLEFHWGKRLGAEILACNLEPGL